jgi:alkylated DNA repair dioxygenase AlkB
MTQESLPFDTKIKNRNNEFKINGLFYKSEFITISEQDELINKIDRQPWLDDLRRRVQHFGYKYDYKARRINQSMKIADFPDWMMAYARKLHEEDIFPDIPDQVIINEYLPGQGIASHIDCEPCFTETVASLSLNSHCVMNLTDKDNPDTAYDYLLEPRSLIILKNEARFQWMHGIKPLKNDKYSGKVIPRKRRISLTFRKVILDSEGD